jgi:hypothetical protein
MVFGLSHRISKKKERLVGARGFEPPTPCAQGTADNARKWLIFKRLKIKELGNCCLNSLNFAALWSVGSYKIIYSSEA